MNIRYEKLIRRAKNEEKEMLLISSWIWKQRYFVGCQAHLSFLNPSALDIKQASIGKVASQRRRKREKKNTHAI